MAKDIYEKRDKFFIENEDFDYMVESYYTPDFNEYVVKVSGDTVTYRVYGNLITGFRIGEK